jgi:hypothetical protein
MADLIHITAPTEGDRDKGLAFGLKGDQFVIPVVGFAFGLLLFVLTMGRMHFAGSVLIGLAPLGLTIAYVLAFLHNRPPHFQADAFDALTEGPTMELSGFQRQPPAYRPPMAKTSRFTDAWFTDRLMIFNELDGRGYAAKGFLVIPPALGTLSTDALNDTYQRLSGFLASIKPPVRIQFQWAITSDYEKEITAYEAETERLAARNEWATLARRQRTTRLRASMRNGDLRREILRLYVSVPLTSEAESALDDIDAYLLEYGQLLSGLFAAYQSTVQPMTGEECFRHCLEILNPGMSSAARLAAVFRPEASLLEQCLAGDIAIQEDHFVLGGMHHACIALRNAPQSLYPGMITRILNASVRGFSVAVNNRPLDLQRERAKAEDQIQRHEGDMTANQKAFHSLKVSRDRKIERVEALTRGQINPFEVEYVFRVCAPSATELAAKCRQIQDIVTLTNGAAAWVFSGRSSRNLLFQTLPGWMFGKYDRYHFPSDDRTIAAFLPFSATYTGLLDGAEALYDGGNGAVVGVRTFVGGTPQHAVLLGTTGCGKSAFMIDLLTQTAPLYDFTCILEEGLSYALYSLTQDSRPLVIHPDSNITINYLDVSGLPLTASHISFCSALLMQMVGFSGDRDRDQLRMAMLARYVQMLYDEIQQSYARIHPEDMAEVARECAATEALMTHLDEWAESYMDLRRALAEGRDRESAIAAAITEEQISDWLTDPARLQRVQQAVFCRMSPKDMADHSSLIEMIRAMRLPDHSREDISRITSALEIWSRTGAYGTLFDGDSNFSLQGRHVHIELGAIPESAGALKQITGFLVSAKVRDHILKMPRALHKRYVFEEAARLLAVEGGEKVMAECYGQMRKFNTWVCSINQNFALFKDSPIRSVIMSNSKQYFLMRQNDREDVNNLGSDIDLPETSKGAILGFPMPETLPPGRKYSSFLYHDKNTGIGGAAHNISSPEMLFVASTSAERFDAARQAAHEGAARGESIVQTIAREAAVPR